MSAFATEYKRDMMDISSMYFGHLDQKQASIIDAALEYSMKKRYREFDANIYNNYTGRYDNNIHTVKQMTDYIIDKKPIMTAHGTLFMRHGTVENPLGDVVQSFMDLRGIHKDKMYTFPKGSADYEYYNLLQSLDKVNANSIYGTLGMFMSLVYDRNVATSITAAGRSFISIAGMFFEQFLSDSVKFRSLNEILMFIDHTVSERSRRKFDDHGILSHWITPAECFAKLILDCGGYDREIYVPDNRDLEIVWQTVCNLTQQDLNRVYYKNNLYEFLNNKSMQKAIRIMISSLQRPFLTPSDCPAEIKAELDAFTDILDEYVMNHFQVMDRMSRWQMMIHESCIISDTDSAFVSLDAWVRYATEVIKDMEYPIKYTWTDVEKLMEEKSAFYRDNPTVRDFDFYRDEVVEHKRMMNPFVVIPQDNVRYSLISIMTHVVSVLCNKYIEESTKTSNSWTEGRKCKMYLKNEFLMSRVMMTAVKKNYASKQELQEGHFIENNIKSALDVKGIECLTKSTKTKSTRDALKKILYEDILNVDEIDQLKVIKDMAILEKDIMASLYSGSKEFYKPATVKSVQNYENPMRIQGIKAILAWNGIKEPGEHAIDLNERNAVSIAKVDVNSSTVERIREKNPALYGRIKEFLASNADFKGVIDTVAVPVDMEVPTWLMDILDFSSIISDNLSGFPLESINIRRANNDNINYMNMLKL